MKSKTVKKRRSTQLTGMQGVYVTAAELSKNGLIVAPTSRSAVGADLLVTDERCKRSWSVQVKTNLGNAPSWLVMSKYSHHLASPTYIYVLVNLWQRNPTQKRERLLPDFYIVPSEKVVKLLGRRKTRIRLEHLEDCRVLDTEEGARNRWQEVFDVDA